MKYYEIKRSEVNVLKDLKIEDPENVTSASLVSNGCILARTTSLKNGEINFWENFYLNLEELQHMNFIIELDVKDENKKINVDFGKYEKSPRKHIDLPDAFNIDGSINVPVNIFEQQYMPVSMEKYNNKYNNIFVFKSGLMGISCCQ